MIITKLQGGLGNQMFQAATGYAVAKQKKTSLKLDLSFLEKNSSSTDVFTARQYELGSFSFNFNIATNEDLELFFTKNLPLKKKVQLKIKRYFLNPVILTDFYGPQEKNNIKTRYIYLDGYWQNENYFKQYRSDIIKLFMFPELDNNHEKIAEDIKSSNSISIHFRLGDYANNPHIKKVHGVLNKEYYLKAIKYIQNKITKPRFYIFSDDVEWVKNNYNFSNNSFSFINTGSAIDDMHLMSLCKHNIIANSTFSWWAAWLNKNNNKIVIAPYQWFKNAQRNKKVIEIIPKKWILI